MANCSQTYGTYEFLLPNANDNTVKALALFVTLMQKRLGNCEYNTYLPDYDNDYGSNLEYVKQNIKPTSGEDIDYKHTLIATFFGTGRWSYRSNVEGMADWMDLNLSDDIIKKWGIKLGYLQNTKEENEKLIELLSNNKIKIVCKYTDFEPGMEILCEGYVTWLLDKTLMLPIIDITETRLDCTYENLVNTGMIEENDTYISIKDIELVKDTIIDVGSYEIEKTAENLGITKEEAISKLTDVLDIKTIKDIGWLCLGDTAISSDCIPEMIYDLAEKHLSYKSTKD